jgi:type VI secretion system secreted protein VgrG
MAEYAQTNRSMQVATPLEDAVLLVTGFCGIEHVSRLFSFEVTLIADNSTTVDFGKLVGQDITVSVATPANGGDADWRYLNGICACFSQGNRNKDFTSYYAEVVPKVWLLTQRAQSRIFQQKSVPDILKEVLKGFDTDFQLRGQYEPREYCVQYRETDFDFASRLMEEEGIYYFFEHSKSGHKMIVADTPQSHSSVPGLTSARYDVVEGGSPTGDHIFEWRKTQALRPSKYTLWDHSFQQPTQNLEAKENILESVRAGMVSHRLKGPPNDPLEIYDFPGGYALRFDGISPSGGAQDSRLQKLFDDNKRTVKLRMEAEATQSLTIHGSSGCRNFVAGHKFTLERHFDGNGDYVLVSVTHQASMGSPYRTGSIGGDLTYSNTFTCIPSQLPYRPPRRTLKPFVQGVQNALVTGPSGEEIFTDKYGRVKVQFYWDRLGKKDANSSCWLRVSTNWAGRQWGAMQVPRIGQEVIVAFVEGNPDEPLIVGSVYNPVTMPPYGPGKGVVSGLKSNTHKGKGYNEMSMDDTAGKEKVTIHGQHDMNATVEHDHSLTVHNNRTATIDVDDNETVGSTQKIGIGSNQSLTVGSNQDNSVGASRTTKVGADDKESVGSNQTISIGVNQNITTGSSRTTNIGTSDSLNVGASQTISVTGPLNITSGASITLTVGGSTIVIGPSGIDLTTGGPITLTAAVIKNNS